MKDNQSPYDLTLADKEAKEFIQNLDAKAFVQFKEILDIASKFKSENGIPDETLTVLLDKVNKIMKENKIENFELNDNSIISSDAVNSIGKIFHDKMEFQKNNAEISEFKNISPQERNFALSILKAVEEHNNNYMLNTAMEFCETGQRRSDLGDENGAYYEERNTLREEVQANCKDNITKAPFYDNLEWLVLSEHKQHKTGVLSANEVNMKYFENAKPVNEGSPTKSLPQDDEPSFKP